LFNTTKITFYKNQANSGSLTRRKMVSVLFLFYSGTGSLL